MYCVVLVTAKDKKEATMIATGILEEKLAACVNIVDNLYSLFWWEGKIDDAQEALLVIKTKEELFELLVQRIKFLHSYQVPEIIALPIIKGEAEYLNWIKSVVGKGEK
ncbi:MAG TPA: divalent-cation tolerance protein CutA [Candidatus Omnitrophota bacterium]|nr:divalent-cation tolerance protein CutA [Candidatus Omnitrophota bacterium]HPN88074.1 divalent-cation tolerance protein CutA [Candidatus Omnitrophota bacterium]